MTLGPLEFTDDCKTGIPSVDAEHRQLVQLANEFIAAAEAGTEPAGLAALLARLIDHTAEHFAAEERLLDRHGYPALATHKVEHERLLTEARSLYARTLDNAGSVEASHLGEEASRFLHDWLLGHIRRDDKPFRPFLMRLT